MRIGIYIVAVAVCGVVGCEKADELGQAAARKATELGNAAAQMAEEVGSAVAHKAGQVVGFGASHFFKGVGEGVEEACAEFKSEIVNKMAGERAD